MYRIYRLYILHGDVKRLLVAAHKPTIASCYEVLESIFETGPLAMQDCYIAVGIDSSITPLHAVPNEV